LVPTVLLLVLSALAAAMTSDWSQFRGPNGSGVYAGRPLPAQLTPDAPGGWSVAVPFGRSSPITHGDRIYLTGSEDDRLITVALDRARGTVLWKHEVRRGRIDERAGVENDSASPTPAADDRGVYVFFPDFGLVAIDHRGRERWRVPLGPFHTSYGMASSPIVIDGLVVQACDQQSGSFLLAVDAATGRERWRLDRTDVREGWYTPAVLRPSAGRTTLVVPGSERVEGIDATTGRQLWALDGSRAENLGVPLVDGHRLYVNVRGVAGSWPTWAAVATEHDANGDARVTRDELRSRPTWIRGFSYADINRDNAISEAEWNRMTSVGFGNFGLTAIDTDPARPDRVHVAWRVEKNLPYVPAPVLYRDTIYMVKTGGILTAVDATSGAIRQEMRVPNAPGEYFASPVAGDGRLFVASQAGVLSVLRIGTALTPAQTLDLGDEIYGTPALSDGAIFVRTRGRLHCFRTAVP
jgi:outer membrane protein assembly factor BamB